MKKLSILIILILGITLVIIPFIVGKVAEQSMYTLLDRFNDEYDKYGELTLVDYKRGIRETRFNFSWKPNDDNFYLSEPLAFNCIGSHGVFSFSHQCSASSIDFEGQTGGAQNPVSLLGNFSLFGEVSEIITFNQFELHQGNNDFVFFLPTTIRVNTNKSFKIFDIETESEGFKLVTQSRKIVVSNLDLVGRGTLNTIKFVIGNVSASTDSISIESMSDEKFVFEGLTMNTITEEDGQNISITTKLNAIDYVYAKSETVDLKNLDFEFKLSGLDMAQLALLNEKIGSVSGRTSSQINANYISLIPVFQDLLKTNLSTTTTFSAEHLSDQITLDANIKLVGDLSFGDVLMLKLNPKSVLAKMDVNYYSTIPLSLINSNPQTMNSITNNSWYMKTDVAYIANFRMIDGDAILNKRQLKTQDVLQMIGR